MSIDSNLVLLTSLKRIKIQNNERTLGALFKIFINCYKAQYRYRK